VKSFYFSAIFFLDLHLSYPKISPGANSQMVMVDMMRNLMGACAAAKCRGLPVLLNTPSALHPRVLRAVVTPPCSTAAERKH
jgi:hypothetical protein